MANEYEYKKYVISNYYTEGVIVGCRFKVLNDHDHPQKWEMKCLATTTTLQPLTPESFWKIEYINNRNTFENPRSHPEELRWSQRHIVGLELYWWCRDGDWLPYWNKSTKQRALLMKEIRTYWLREWLGKTIPTIKNILLETTKLIPDIVNELPNYLEYPYQTKDTVVNGNYYLYQKLYLI